MKGLFGYAKGMLFAAFVVCLVVLVSTNAAMGWSSDYFIWDDWGGTYSDAEKSPTNQEDDLLCWAAAASNTLEWTGWGKTGGMKTTDQMFKYYQDHWIDAGGFVSVASRWWFDGVDVKPWTGASHVDVSGGGFYPDYNFDDYFHIDGYTNMLLKTDEYLHAGRGTTLNIYGPMSHVVTVWGFRYDECDPDYYTGIYITDSDDAKGSDSPSDELRYYGVNLLDGRWYLEDYYSLNNAYIGLISGLDRMPDCDINLIPAPSAFLLCTLGVGLVGRLKKQISC